MSNADDALAAAEAAEAEAAEAEAAATAARARARAVRLRHEAEAAAAEKKALEDAAEAKAVPSAVEIDEPSETVEIDTPSETVGAAVAEDAPKRRGLRLSAGFWKVAATVVTVIATVGLLALSATMYVSHRNVEAQRQHSAEFAAAARQGVVTLMSLDFNKAEEDVKRIIDNTTGDFKKEFEGQAEDFVNVSKESKVITEASVNAFAVQKMTEDTATVLVAVMTRVSNAASQQQEPRAWRLSVDVARDGDQIKLAKVEFVP